MFADDAKIYATLVINDDGVNLIDKLKCVEKWCSEWQLSISVKKCAVMHIHIYWLQDHGCRTQLCYRKLCAAVDHVKDLGVIIDEQLKFHLHINHVVASAFTRANLILKCFTSSHVQTLLRAFKTIRAASY